MLHHLRSSRQPGFNIPIRRAFPIHTNLLFKLQFRCDFPFPCFLPSLKALLDSPFPYFPLDYSDPRPYANNPFMICMTHHFYLCAQCSKPSLCRFHNESYHFSQPMHWYVTWTEGYVRLAPRPNGNSRPASGGSAFSSTNQSYQPRDDGNGITRLQVGGTSYDYTTPTVASGLDTFLTWIAANGGRP